MVADSHAQQCVHLLRDFLAVTLPDRIEQLFPIPNLRAVIKPFDDRIFKNIPDFRIWNHKCRHAFRQFNPLFTGQIAGQIQDTPQVFLGRMKIIVSEIFLDALHDIAAGQQRFHFPGDTAARIVDERADNRVIAGIFPVSDGHRCRIALHIPQIAHHIPRAVHIEIPEVITVIPCLNLFRLIPHPCIIKNPIHFCLSKSKIFAQTSGCNCI